MKSRITIEVDFENGNQPTIMVNLQKSDDVRDKLLSSFIEKFSHQSSWCKAFYGGSSDNSDIWYITPIESKHFKEEANLINALCQDPSEKHKIKMAANNPEFPRRNYMAEWTSQEIDIYNLMHKIEKLGAHPLLTDVVNHLEQAKEKLADWIEIN